MRTKKTKEVTKRFMEVFHEIVAKKKMNNDPEANLRGMAKKLGHSGSNFHKFKSLERDVTLDMIEKIVRLYNVNANWIFTGNGKKYLTENKGDDIGTVLKEIRNLKKSISTS